MKKYMYLFFIFIIFNNIGCNKKPTIHFNGNESEKEKKLIEIASEFYIKMDKRDFDGVYDIYSTDNEGKEGISLEKEKKDYVSNFKKTMLLGSTKSKIVAYQIKENLAMTVTEVKGKIRFTGITVDTFFEYDFWKWKIDYWNYYVPNEHSTTIKKFKNLVYLEKEVKNKLEIELKELE